MFKCKHWGVQEVAHQTLGGNKTVKFMTDINHLSMDDRSQTLPGSETAAAAQAFLLEATLDNSTVKFT